MIELQELDKKSWNKGFCISVTFDKWSRDGRLYVEVSGKSEVYKNWSAYKKTGNPDNLTAIIRTLEKDDFLRNEYFRKCVLVPVPSFEIKTPVSELVDQMASAFDVPVVEKGIISSLHMDESVPLDKWENKRRPHPVDYIPDCNVLNKYPKETRFLIVDDIYDTGSTMESIASGFAENGYRNIDIFVLCATVEAKQRIKVLRDNKR